MRDLAGASARSSRSYRCMQNSTLGEGSMDHRSLHAFPILGVALADDDDIERHPERAERSTETHHLGVSVLEVALHDEEVEVTVRTCIAAGTRAEEHDLDRIGSDGRQRLGRRLDDILRNHRDTVAKLPGGPIRRRVTSAVWFASRPDLPPNDLIEPRRDERARCHDDAE